LAGHVDALLLLYLWILMALAQTLKKLLPDFLYSVSFSFFWDADQRMEAEGA
jgi:hypothetical protein